MVCLKDELTVSDLPPWEICRIFSDIGFVDIAAGSYIHSVLPRPRCCHHHIVAHDGFPGRLKAVIT